MFMILLVLDNPSHFDAILNSWDEIGIRGATVFESTGIGRHLQHLIPMRYIFRSQSDDEEGNLTIMAIVESQKIVDRCLQATEKITGNLDDPDTGIFAAWPLAVVKGLPPKKD
jgi:nitrogen regulatory protein PII